MDFLLSKTFAIIGLAVFVLIWKNKNRQSRKLPPGPKKRPIVGSLLEIPSTNEWETYAKWSKEFNSDVIHVGGIGKDLIILNSVEAAREFLDRRSAAYSSRPPLPMGSLMGWDFLFGNMPYGEAWRKRRGLFQQYFSRSNPRLYQSEQLEHIKRVLPLLLDDPNNTMDLLKHTMGAINLSLAYGINIKPKNDPYVELAERALKPGLAALIPGAFLVNTFPILRFIPDWFPGANFKRKAKEWKKLAIQFRDVPFMETKRALAEGTAKTSFVSISLDALAEETSPSPDAEEIIQDTAAQFFAAGTDTTLSTIHTFILAMLTHPEIQTKAQQELDQTIGHGRIPEWSDQPNLPYISAILKEVFRWRPVAPIGMPHTSETNDDIYNDYHIPKGSIMMPNIRAMLHNTTQYPNPNSFNPNRFLSNPNSTLDPTTIAFGFGRRICPGEQIARSTLWITATSLLALFTISKPVKNGIVIEPSGKYASLFVNAPEPFEFDLRPRSEMIARSIRAMGDN